MVDLYVNDITNALKNGCYFSALAMTLALPDICGAAEYPDETSVGKRYIEWYDKFLGEYVSNHKDEPYLSGEVVYNLRNTFLHTGSPNIDSSKVKNETNQLDSFILMLGDGTKIWSSSLFIDTPIVKVRKMLVDVTYLCQTICDCSLWYYKNNTIKFHFDFSAVTQEDMFSEEFEPPSGDLLVQIANKKLKQLGDTRRFKESQDHTMADDFTGGLNYIFSNEELKQKYLNGEEITLERESTPADTPVMTSNTEPKVIKESAPKNKSASTSKKKTPPDKREAQVRSFFGQNFKEQKYKQKKEVIIQSVLQSKTKQQVNNALMKSFGSEETGVIYKRLSPLLASLPGK